MTDNILQQSRKEGIGDSIAGCRPICHVFLFGSQLLEASQQYNKKVSYNSHKIT